MEQDDAEDEALEAQMAELQDVPHSERSAAWMQRRRLHCAWAKVEATRCDAGSEFTLVARAWCLLRPLTHTMLQWHGHAVSPVIGMSFVYVFIVPQGALKTTLLLFLF